MNIDILPVNLRPVKIRICKRGSKGVFGEVSVPTDVINRYNLQNGEIVVIAFICKADQDIKDIVKPIEIK